MRLAAGESAFPWDEVMALGFGVLRLSPAEFWAMTPREIERAMSVHRPARIAAPARAALDHLMTAFPDGG